MIAQYHFEPKPAWLDHQADDGMQWEWGNQKLGMGSQT